MKASLLLMGLVMSAGFAGTVQAADVTVYPHMSSMNSQTLVATSVAGHGVLSTLSNLLSGKTQSNDKGHDCDHADQTASGRRQPPGPTPTPPISGHSHTVSTSSVNTDPPPAATAGDSAQPPAEPPQPSLGWQSLLPGSIQ